MLNNFIKTLQLTIILSFIIFSFTSCQKDTNSSSKTPAELLTSHKWKFFRVGDTNDDVNISWSPVTDNCEKDDFWEFKTSGRLTWDNSAIKCSSTAPQILYDGTWQFASNNTIIKLNNGADPDLKIVNLTENSLTVIELDGRYPHDCYDLIPY